jgi:undecaprenyl-diphosphatase
MFLGVGIMMIVMALVLFVADRIGKKVRSVEKIEGRDAVIIGLAQALALFPGVSRSGSTITAGLFTGLSREAAARFSFLLATPIILGAALLKIMEVAKLLLHHEPLDAPLSMMAVGFVVSAVVGYAAISGLLKYIKRGSMLPFVVYRVLFGIAVIALYMHRL